MNSIERTLNDLKIPFTKGPKETYIIDLADIPKTMNIDQVLKSAKNNYEDCQVCSECGSIEVARCKWVNVNTDEIYNADSETTLEWCMECKSECEIVSNKDWTPKVVFDAIEVPGNNDLMTEEQKLHEWQLQQESQQEQENEME